MTLVSDQELADYCLGVNVDVGDDISLIIAANNAASALVEQHCRRSFTLAGDTATARTFGAIDPHRVAIDDVADVTDFALATDDDDDGVFEVTWASTDWELGPLNQATYTHVRAVDSRTFPTRTRRTGIVQVTARWGWPAVPALVKQATLELGKDCYRARSTQSGLLVDQTTGAVVSVRTNRLAASWLTDFVRHDRAGIA